MAEPALVEMAERRLQKQTDKEADTRHYDTLSVEELAFVFGLNVDEEKARKKMEMDNTPRRRVMTSALMPIERIEEDEEEMVDEGEE
jgi:hypothetical protein